MAPGRFSRTGNSNPLRRLSCPCFGATSSTWWGRRRRTRPGWSREARWTSRSPCSGPRNSTQSHGIRGDRAVGRSHGSQAARAGGAHRGSDAGPHAAAASHADPENLTGRPAKARLAVRRHGVTEYRIAGADPLILERASAAVVSAAFRVVFCVRPVWKPTQSGMGGRRSCLHSAEERCNAPQPPDRGSRTRHAVPCGTGSSRSRWLRSRFRVPRRRLRRNWPERPLMEWDYWHEREPLLFCSAPRPGCPRRPFR